MMTSSKTTLAFFIYGLLVHCSVCSPLSYPNVRMETAGFDEEGNSLADLTFDSDQITIQSSPSVSDDAYTLFYPPSKRMERHADGMFNKAYRKALGQLSARKYLHALMAKRVGGGNTIEDDNEPLSKRHSDGVFTDSYSRYRKQMAVKKYLATVLGKSPEDLDLHQFLQDIDFGVFLDGDENVAFWLDWLIQVPPEFPAL
ncbi:glucagon family neuropeptides-like [Xyrauchen texanus]|uniref:glucagon family neuropeptides-like n=1 Tax=Xyrauchen texanus TaxID=154827 RepID=UPI0022420F38|nr:glucagon family neuropeptides-like [Xyrauchen texanus]